MERSWTDNLIGRKCPCCGKDDAAIVSKKMKDGANLTTAICKECALVYTNPIPERDVYNRFYTKAYNNYYIYRPTLVLPESCPVEFKEKINIIGSFLTDSNSAILEIGSGEGGFLYWLRQKFKNATGLEPGLNIIPAIERFGLSAVNDFFETHDFENSKYDALAMIHVFEHFYDINATLTKCRSILNDKGYLFFEIPNIHKPFRSLDKYFLRYVHLINYSEETIEKMLLKHSFKVVYMETSPRSPLSPRNLVVVAQKMNSSEKQFDPADYKKTIRVLWFYRIRWMLYLKHKMSLQITYFATRRHIRKQLLKTELGVWLKKHLRREKVVLR